MNNFSDIETRQQLPTERYRFGIFEYIIKSVHGIDAMASECGEGYDNYYDFIDYEFSGLGCTVFARQYKDSADEVSFRGVSRYGRRSGTIKRADFRTRIFRAAVKYFDNKGLTQQKYLGGKRNSGYSPIPRANGALSNPIFYIVVTQLLFLIVLLVYMWP
jgi:hypothetical protein